MIKQILFSGQHIQYKMTGNGPAVILLHGFGETGTVWNNQLPVLSNYKLIIPDLPGSGSSPLIGDMSMEGLAACVLAILDHEKISSCAMIGHSMGGYITLAFADLYPGRLTGFGLFHSSAYADNEEKIETRKKGIQFIIRNGAMEFLKTSILNLYSPGSKKEHPEWIEQHLQAASGLTDAALIAYYESMIGRQERTGLLKATALPVLFILGEFDNAVPLKDGLQQSHLPHLTFVHILKNAGHMGMIEMPDESNEYLLRFLSFIYQPQLRS